MPLLQNFKKDSGEKANRQLMAYARMYLHLTFERKVLTQFAQYGKQKFDYALVSVSTESKKRNLNSMKLQKKVSLFSYDFS